MIPTTDLGMSGSGGRRRMLAATMLLAMVAGAASEARTPRNVHGGVDDTGDLVSHLDADDPDFSGIVDFSNAIPGPGGSWCITKTKYVDHMVKDQIKECWHQNVTQCHDTYVTEFLPSQEQKCEESFWKSCKIDFREMPYNYTMKQCHTPLVKMCDPDPAYGKPTIVCKTWFESECNTTYTETSPNIEDKPNTWCKKVPRKICAPDNCKMVPGAEECSDKTLVSTVQRPTELCDLQPQQHCRLITRLIPHLISKEVCRNIPKEVCHLALSQPKQVKKPITLKWCTKKKDGHGHGHQALRRGGASGDVPTYKPTPSYLPPPPPPPPPQLVASSRASARPVPTSYGIPTARPIQNFHQRAEDPAPPLPTYTPTLPSPEIAPPPQSSSNPDPIRIVTPGAPRFPPPRRFRVGGSAVPSLNNAVRRSDKLAQEVVEKDIFGAKVDKEPEAFQPVFQEQFQPASVARQSVPVVKKTPFRPLKPVVPAAAKEEKTPITSTSTVVLTDEELEAAVQKMSQDRPILPALISDDISSAGGDIVGGLVGDITTARSHPGSFFRRRRRRRR